MTREEAITILECERPYGNSGCGATDEEIEEALSMAIKALEHYETVTEFADRCKECGKVKMDEDCIRRSDIGLTDFEIVMCDGNYKQALEMLLSKIEKAPPVNPQPKTGHWIMRKRDSSGWKDTTVYVNSEGTITESRDEGAYCECSECGEWLVGSDEYACGARYCPNCGAKMQEVEE